MDQDMELTALVEAVNERNAPLVATILSRAPDLSRAEVVAEHGHTQTLLHRAIPGDGDPLTDEDLAIVGSLLDAGADVNTPGWGANNGLCAPITMAAWGGHARVIRLLVSRGADPNGSAEQIARGHRPIDVAADHGHAEAVEALIEAGAASSLAHLLRVGAKARLQRVLVNDPAAAVRSLPDGTPPLHLAVISPHAAPVLETLMEHGAALDAADALGRTALHVAIEHQHQEAIRLLLERGASIDIFAGAGVGQAERVARRLAEEPSLARAAQADGVTALFYAAWAGDAGSTWLLLDAGAEVSPRAKRFWACLTPLHAAIQQRHREVVTALLDRGADVDAAAAEPGQYWPTPLHVAARWGTHEDVTLLLDHGADPNGGSPVADSLDTGGLTWAVCAGDVALVQLMLERGLDLAHERHREALHRAAERGHVAMVRLLIERGADPRAVDTHGETPLERARSLGKPAVVQLLEAYTG
jgi:ankyrin repeat protein